MSADAIASEGAKNLNLGVPVSGKQLRAFGSLFTEGKYFAHLAFGFRTGRIEPEEIIKNLNPSMLGKYGFLLLLGFLIRNGLDVNYYFTGPYNVRIHIAVYLYNLNVGSPNKDYIFDLLESAGSTFSLSAYTGGMDSGRKTVKDVLGNQYNRPGNSVQVDLEDLFDQGPTISGSGSVDRKIEIKYGVFRNILLDQKFAKGDKEDILGFLNTLPKGKEFVMRSVIMYLAVTTGAVNCLKESSDEPLFLNTLGNMSQSTYMAINSQNTDVFEVVLNKGAECNYICMTELIARHNEASSNDDKILAKAYGDMIEYAVLTGARIDNYQLQYLSLEASVELIEKVRTNHEEPEWKKACNRTVPGDKKQFSVKRLRQIAFDLNLDFNLSPTTICDKLDRISNIDRTEFAKSSIERQEERVERALMEVGDIREGEALQRRKCNAKSTLINNPYAYNDARMAFYKDDEGELWCFTSDFFESMIASNRNPYTNKPLPRLFLETIKTQLNILKFLDLAKPRDSRTISQAVEEIFDKRMEINNKFSDESYTDAVNIIRLLGVKTGTGNATMNEQDFRSKSLSIKNIIQRFVRLSFYFSVDSNLEIHQDFRYNQTLTPVSTNPGIKNSVIDMYTSSPSFLYEQTFIIYKMFEDSKMAKNLNNQGFQELYFRVVAYNLLHFYKNFNQGSTPNGNYYSVGKCVDIMSGILEDVFSS